MPIGAFFGRPLAMNLDSHIGLDANARAAVDQLDHDYLVKYAAMLDDGAAQARELWKDEPTPSRARKWPRWCRTPRPRRCAANGSTRPRRLAFQPTPSSAI